MRLVLVLSLFVGQVACSPVPEPDPQPPSIVGTWRVIEHTPAAGGDSLALRFGPTPRGYLVYDATGHVFLQVQDAQAADSVRSRWRDAPDSIVRKLLHGFQAYFGTYTIDSVAQIVAHRIEGELLPRFGSVEVATPFRIRGDSLILGADSLEQWHFIRVR